MLLAFVALAASALAEMHPPHEILPPEPILGGTPIPVSSPLPIATMRPVPIATLHPIVLPSDNLEHRYVHAVRSGRKIPLWRLPKVPVKTAFNTIRPGKNHHGGRYRPFAATGATIQVTAAAACSTGGTIGDLFNEGCQLTIQAQNASSWSASDSYQYYVIAPDSPTTATEIGGSGGGCTPTTDPWTATNAPSCTGTSTTLSEQGTYAFLVYDTTARVFAAAIYVNAGQVFTVEVFQDAFHTEQAYQFNISTSNAAYIYLANVAPSDHYVVYVESTGVNVYCAYLAPTGTTNGATPRPTGSPGKLVCDPSTSNVTGVQAPSGSLSLTWQFASTLESGSYAVLVYDQDAGETMGQVQVSLTSSGGVSMLTSGSATGANNPSPGPYNSSPQNATILAWDSSSDQSVGGITGTIQAAIPGSTYEWTISNPEGRVMATSAPVTVATPSATPSPQAFAFSGFTVPPGEYPASYWVMELYDTINKKIEASQSFKLLGYHATTQFVQSGTATAQLEFNGYNPGTETADLKITNDSNTVYDNQGDSFGQGAYPAIEFTTGGYPTLNESFTPPTAGETGCGTAYKGCGTTFEIPSCSGNYNSAGGCSKTVQDSSGNNWTATEWCSTNTPTYPLSSDLCVLQLTPQNDAVLSPGAYIDIQNVTWYANGGSGYWPCYFTPCYGVTSVLPTHGLSWSYTNNSSNPIAWTPVSFGSNIGYPLSGTVKFDYVGARPTPPALVTQGTTPWTNAHYFQSYFTRAAYQRSTPWSSSRSNVASFLITNNSTTSRRDSNYMVGSNNPGLAISMPSYFTPSQVTVDSSSSGSWSKVTCPSTFGTQYVCLNGPAIAGGGNTSTVLLDFPLPVSSFTFTDMTIEAWSEDELSFFTLTNNGTTESTIDGCTDCSGEPTGGVDSLGIGAYSLNSALMSAVFSPSTVGSSSSPTDLSITVQNATTSSDPNPDAIDAIVIVSSPPPAGETTSDYAVSGTPTMTRQDGTSWNWLGRVTASSPSNTYEYWFGACPSGTSNWGTLSGGPPQPAGLSTPLSSQYTGLATCGTTEHNSLWNDSSHSEGTINLNLAGPLASGTHTFYLYAHGANGGGWSAPKTITLNVASESASAGFASVGSTCPGTAVSTNSTPIVTSNSNCYIYTIKNTSSGSTKITAPVITIPAFDTSGLSANAWSVSSVKLGTYSGGTFTQGSGNSQYGCTVTSTTAPNPGVTNGSISIGSCTGFSPGDTLAVEFQATSPSVQNDTYAFPSTVDGNGTGATWLGDQDIMVEFSIGLSVVVAPLSNPGPGYSTPSQSCSQCGFSGTTIDFGTISSGGSVTATDVARATVVYGGSCTSSCSTWQLQVSASGDAQGIGELSTMVDSVNGSTSSNDPTSSNGSPVTYSALTSFTAMPSSPTTFASGPEQELKSACSGSSGEYCTDTIHDYKVSVGTDTSSHTVTVTYTLIAN